MGIVRLIASQRAIGSASQAIHIIMAPNWGQAKASLPISRELLTRYPPPVFKYVEFKPGERRNYCNGQLNVSSSLSCSSLVALTMSTLVRLGITLIWWL